MLQDAKVLITGATGQVAFPVARALAPNNEVHALARFTAEGSRERLEALGIRWWAEGEPGPDTTGGAP